jgi:uncharacterized OB-fold protein
MAEERTKPLPGEMLRISTNRFTEPFWEATRDRRLIIAKCTHCGTLRHPPGPYCANCQHQDIEWIEPNGEGTIYSYTICRRSPYPGKVADFTYAPIVVELSDAPGIRVISTLVDGDPADIAIGAKVQLDWNSLPDGLNIPTFRLV